MARTVINNIKLGIFVIAGLAFLILLLYMIGKNEHLFGKNFVLKARFENVRGLVAGNNVRFAGIDAGTVKNVIVINDTTIEVVMLIKTKMKPFIRKNSLATIGTDGLMGNRLLNIEAVKEPAATVNENDIIASKPGVDTDEMLKILNATTSDIAIIASELKASIQRLNTSTALWTILNDESIPVNFRKSLTNVRKATEGMDEMMLSLNDIIDQVHEGRGSLGTLIRDTSFVTNLNMAVQQITHTGNSADSLSRQLDALVKNIHEDVDHGKGMANALLKDSILVQQINTSLVNINKGASGFNDIMGALKKSFLFRGYFRRQQKNDPK